MIGLTLTLTAVTAVLSFGGAHVMCRLSQRFGFTDAPNERSSHRVPTPRAGGIGFALAVPLLTAYGLHAVRGDVSAPEATLLVASTVLAMVGLADDRWRLPAGVRFVAHITAACSVVAAGGVVETIWIPGAGMLPLGVAAAPATIVWLVALTNIYNFMDGIDGIAAAQAIIAGATLAMLAFLEGERDLLVGMAVIAGGAAGFLALNLPPARVFMGDVGSTFLGFMLAGWAAMPRSAAHPVPFLAWCAVLSPFLIDSTVTLVRRVVRGERIFEAHRMHFYQRLVQSGWTHAQTTGLYSALAVIAGIAATCILRVR